MTIVASIGGFLFGYDTGIIAASILHFKDTWPEITNGEREMIVSIALLGAFFAVIIAGPLSDMFGRKLMILTSSILVTGGAITIS